MLALRRASLPLRNRGLRIDVYSASFLDLKSTLTCIRNESAIVSPPISTSDQCPSYKRFSQRRSHCLFLVRRGFALLVVGDSSKVDGEFKDKFSELESIDSDRAVESEGDPVSEPDFSEDEGDGDFLTSELEILDKEGDLDQKSPSGNKKNSALFKAIISAPGLSINKVLDKWVEEGNDLDRKEISKVIFRLNKSRMLGRALQFSKWLEKNKKFEFVEIDYSCRLNLIAGIYGSKKAREYIESIPESFRGELIYRTLLSIYVRTNAVRKAEELFKEIKGLGLPVTSYIYNQLLHLYKRNNKQKMEDVLLLMKKENVKPSISIYNLLIDAKGESNDINGMEQLYNSMSTEGVDPDNNTKLTLARHYASAGLKDKAKAVLKEMEDEKTRRVHSHLLQIYAEFGEAEEVRRVWKACEPKPLTSDYIAAVKAWGKLKNVEEAEAVFEKMLEAVEKPSSEHFIPLLKLYADHKMLCKGKELVKRMADRGCQIGPWTWDLLIKLCIDVGEIEVADALLHKAARQRTTTSKPTISSYMAVMDQYSMRGDVHSTEKIFHLIKEAGYIVRYHQFQSLVQAYVNAKRPVYGMRDRMKADKFYPNKVLGAQLATVDGLKRTVVNDFLDELL